MSNGGAARTRPKYQVFISSTQRDLREEREAVTFEILKARHIPAGMESFPAANDRGWEIIEQTINDSDYYVLIVAGLYGSVDAATGLSWTEKEYDYAVSQRIPVLAFIRDASAITADKMDSDEGRRRQLAAFTKKVEDAHLRRTWKTREELTGLVLFSLLTHINDDEARGRARPGWYRGDQGYGPEVATQLARLVSENAKLVDENKTLREASGSNGGPNIRLAVSTQDGALPIEGEPVTLLTNPEASTYRIPLVLVNQGSRIATNIQLRVQLEYAGKIHRDVEEYFGISVAAVHDSDGKSTRVDFRLPRVGIGQDEPLVPLGVFHDVGDHLRLKWIGLSEDGYKFQGDGEIRFQARQLPPLP